MERVQVLVEERVLALTEAHVQLQFLFLQWQKDFNKEYIKNMQETTKQLNEGFDRTQAKISLLSAQGEVFRKQFDEWVKMKDQLAYIQSPSWIIRMVPYFAVLNFLLAMAYYRFKNHA